MAMPPEVRVAIAVRTLAAAGLEDVVRNAAEKALGTDGEANVRMQAG